MPDYESNHGVEHIQESNIQKSIWDETVCSAKE